MIWFRKTQIFFESRLFPGVKIRRTLIPLKVAFLDQIYVFFTLEYSPIPIKELFMKKRQPGVSNFVNAKNSVVKYSSLIPTFMMSLHEFAIIMKSRTR
jgi:hypothetical protein